MVSITLLKPFLADYMFRQDQENKLWKPVLTQVTGTVEITVVEGFYKDPAVTPPKNEDEGMMAVLDLQSQLLNGAGNQWHVTGATVAHELYHRREFIDAAEYFWKHDKMKERIENLSVSSETYPTWQEAAVALRPLVAEELSKFHKKIDNYTKELGDNFGDRPYRVAQKVINPVIQQIQAMGKANNWYGIPEGITPVGETEPPCYKPPVNEMYNQ